MKHEWIKIKKMVNQVEVAENAYQSINQPSLETTKGTNYCTILSWKNDWRTRQNAMNFLRAGGLVGQLDRLYFMEQQPLNYLVYTD